MSEVAELRRRIEQECEALRLYMNGFRTTASHDIISNQYNAITPIQLELAGIVGDAEATRITVETYIQIVG